MLCAELVPSNHLTAAPINDTFGWTATMPGADTPPLCVCDAARDLALPLSTPAVLYTHCKACSSVGWAPRVLALPICAVLKAQPPCYRAGSAVVHVARRLLALAAVPVAPSFGRGGSGAPFLAADPVCAMPRADAMIDRRSVALCLRAEAVGAVLDAETPSDCVCGAANVAARLFRLVL